MNKNVGSADRLIRILLAIVIGVLGYIYQSWWGLVAIVPLATGLMNYCPLYCPLKISSRKKEA